MAIRHFYVRGRGSFPLDMLRYDSCWPATSEDVAKIESDVREPRTIKLMTAGNPHAVPTVGRWSSFLWSASLQDVWGRS
jgi:hypothetical protein